MKKIIFAKIFNLLALILLTASCSQLDGPQPLESNSIPPGKVSNIQIENLEGKAKLTYTLPSNKDLLYVKATYTLENGTPMEVKSSYYNNSMLLEGFVGLKPIKVNLYAVNRSETVSEPIEITVNPLEAPIFDIYRSIAIQNDFGGLYLTATNKSKIDVSILVMTKNEEGDFEPLPNSIYTSTEFIKKSIRGMDTIPKPIAVVVRDRWLNVTDTIHTTIKPLYESVISTNNYKGLRLDNDPVYYEEFDFNKIKMSVLWDGKYGFPQAIITRRDAPDTKLNTITFDLGQSVVLSRVHIWDYRENNSDKNYYYLGGLRYFKIWGTNTVPNQNGSWDNWTLLGEYEVIKPSGLPSGQTSNEDVIVAKAGQSYSIPLGTPKMRYLRIESKENWGKVKGLAIADLLVYGDPRN
jgi:hypothetical protein